MGTVGYLLDTHAFLWAVYDEAKLSDAAQAFTENLVLLTNDPVFDSLPWLQIQW
jgi:PIN domain nuclease of toxin-antitoxin system